MTPVSEIGWKVDSLTVRRFPDATSMAGAAADDVASVLGAAVAARGEANAMFATGNSQLGFLAALVRRRHLPWAQIRVTHMDDYIGLPPGHPAGFGRYIRERLAGPVSPAEAHYIDGSAPDPEGECERYAALLAAHPLDLCVMGIGENGHLAFNDPHVADFEDPLAVKVVELDAACRRQQVAEGHFASLAEVPARAITVTIPALLSARDVVVICPEARKAPAVKRALEGPIEPACPASVLRRAPHARLYLDADSAALVTPPPGPSTGPSTGKSTGKSTG